MVDRSIIVNLPLAVGIDGSEWLPIDQSDGHGGYVTRRTTTGAVGEIANQPQPNLVPGVYGSALAIPQITVDSSGRITEAVNINPTIFSGTVSSVGLAAPADFAVSGSPITVAGTLTFDWAVAPTGTGALVRETSPTITSPTLVTPDLGTPSALILTNATGMPSSIDLTNGTGLPIAGLSGLAAGMDTFLATPSSANLAATVTGETGSGALVFGTSPALASPTMTGATITNPIAITGVPAPTNSGDAVNKAYADGIGAGLSIRASCDVATTAALAANTYANGTLGVGATLTANANGSISPIDGHVTLVGDRVLVKNEVTKSHNGIYAVTQLGDGSHPYILTRATDYDTQAEITSGSFTFVVNGTANGDKQWGQTTDNPITVGTTSIVFTQIGIGAVTYTAGTGLALSGSNVFSLDAAGVATPLANNLTGTVGTSPLYARQDHVHPHGNAYYFIEDFRLGGDTSWTQTANRAITALQAAGGGTLVFQATTYAMGPVWQISPISGQGWEIIVQGQGWGTILQFDNTLAGNDGVQLLGGSGRFSMRDLRITGANRYGINTAGSITTRGTGTTTLLQDYQHILIESCGSDGFRAMDSYMLSLRDCQSRSNGGYGFAFYGFHTSCSIDKCWGGGAWSTPGSGGNALGGWWLNGMAYSTLSACAADFNSGPGYTISNSAGLTLVSCGAENNTQDGCLVVSSSANSSGLPAIILGIHGLTLEGLLTSQNGTAGGATYGEHLRVQTTNGLTATVLEIGGNGQKLSSTVTNSVVLDCQSGTLEYTFENRVIDGPQSENATGTLRIKNRNYLGLIRSVAVNANQSIANAATATVAFNTNITNDFGGALSGNGIVIPADVRRVRIEAGAVWASSAAGTRQLQIMKNGSYVSGAPAVNGNGDGNNRQIVSATIAVTAGDIITAQVTQTSGGALNLLGGATLGTYLTVAPIS